MRISREPFPLPFVPKQGRERCRFPHTPVRFSRQKVLGKYIADFYSAEAKLVIELDGSQHYEDVNAEKDTERTAFLEGYGLTVIRIPNNEVTRNFRGVCEYIDAAVKQSLSQKSEDF